MKKHTLVLSEVRSVLVFVDMSRKTPGVVMMHEDIGQPPDARVRLTPTQARELSSVLLAVADSADRVEETLSNLERDGFKRSS
jgi:hypothetical protein